MEPESDVRAAVRFLQNTTAVDLFQLMALWRSHDSEKWSPDVEVYRLFGERCLRLGEPLVSFDAVSEGLENWPNDFRLKQLYGLALSRSGASERANVVLSKLRREGRVDEETLGMLARTHKDIATNAREPAEREMHLRLASEIYCEAYKLTGGYWTGINAATMSLVVGEEGRAKMLATNVREQCLKALKCNPLNPYWLFATVGEASLVLHEFTEAEDWYAKASGFIDGRYGDVSSSRSNARLVLQYWDADAAGIERWLQVPNVAVFAGHLLDDPSRTSPRFPPQLETTVAAEIRERIKKLNVRFGYSSAACGSDIIFLETMLDCGGEICVVMPYETEEFLNDSVNFAGGDWPARMERVLSKATRVVTASPQKLAIGAVSFDYTNQVMLGLATIRARQLETKLTPLAVWDGQPGDGSGGTESVIQRWRSLGHKIEIVKLNELVSQHPTHSTAASHHGTKEKKPVNPEPRVQFGSEIMAMLFADAVGFSKLTEAQVPQFVEHFLGGIADLINASPNPPVSKNTWGDGLYFVFSNVTDAGQFALDLCHFVTTTSWKEYGLPKTLGLRIALHAGPVYGFEDPITGHRTYSGTHVNRAARIEPITPPGQVYSSEAFAALSAIQSLRHFSCDYVGQTPHAKGSWSSPTYHVRQV